MAVTIKIQNKVIKFPTSAESPNWAPALVEFAKAVESAIGTITGQFDVAPQTLNIDSYNPGTNIDIPALNFPNTDVVSTQILYSVVRTTDSNEVYEAGELRFLYDNSKPIGNKWDITNKHQGDALIEFSITDNGQVQFSTEAISGLNHTGFISFRAISVLNN